MIYVKYIIYYVIIDAQYDIVSKTVLVQYDKNTEAAMSSDDLFHLFNSRLHGCCVTLKRESTMESTKNSRIPGWTFPMRLRMKNCPKISAHPIFESVKHGETTRF